MSENNKKRSRKSKLVPSTYVDLDKLETSEKDIEIKKNNIQAASNPEDEAAAAKAFLFASNVNAPVEIRVKIESDDNSDWCKDLQVNASSETTSAVTSDARQDKDINLDVAGENLVKDVASAKDDGSLFVIDSQNFKNILNEYMHKNKNETVSMINDKINHRKCRSYKRDKDRVSREVGKVFEANDAVDVNNVAKVIDNKKAVKDVEEVNMAPVFGKPSKIITYKKLSPKFKVEMQNFIAAASEYCSGHTKTISQDFVDSVKVCRNLLDENPALAIEMVCTVCDKSFNALPSFQTHLNEHHSNESNKLNVSSIITKQRLIIAARDLKTINCDSTYIDGCLAKAINLSNLRLKTNLFIQSYKCYVCRKSWEHYAPFKNHLYLHHDVLELELHAEITERHGGIYLSVATKWRTELAHNAQPLTLYNDEGAPIYKCFDCDTYFPDAGSYSEHRLNVAKCLGCKLEATCPFVKKHENKCNFFFSKTLPKTCQCGAILTTKTELTDHRKVCTQGSHMLAFHCHICTDRVTTIELLARHMKENHVVRSDQYIQTPEVKIHNVKKKKTETQPLKCRYCERQFETMAVLNIHNFQHKNKLQCGQCSKVVLKGCMMLEHVITEHSSDKMVVYVCCLCGEMRLTYHTLHQHFMLRHFKHIGLFALNDTVICWKKIFPFKKDIHVNNEKCFFVDAEYINSKPNNSVLKVTNTTVLNEEIIIDTDVKEQIEGIVPNDKDMLLDNDVGYKQASQNNENNQTNEDTPINMEKDDNSSEIKLGKDDEIITDKSAEGENTQGPVLQEILNNTHDIMDIIDSENMREITNQTNKVVSNTTADIEMEDDHTPNIADVCESYNQNSHTMEVEDIKPDVSELNKAMQLTNTANTNAQTHEREAQENTDIVIKKEIDCDASDDSGNIECDTRKRDIRASYLELIRAIVDPEEVKQEDHFEITEDTITIPGTSQVVLTKHTSNGYTFEYANGIKLETKLDSEDVAVRELNNSPSELTIDQFILNNSEVTIPEIDHHLADETDDSEGTKKSQRLYTCKKCFFTGTHREFRDHKESVCWRRKKRNSDYAPKSTLCFDEYNCSKCDSAFESLKLYVKHLEWHNYNKKCPECLDEFVYISELNLHIMSHLRGNYQKVFCLKSEKGEPRQTGLTYQCEKCAKSFEKHLLWQHWESHLVIGQKVKEEPKTTILKHADPKIRYCIRMLVAFKRKSQTCQLCNSRMFARVAEMKRHIIEHLLRDALIKKSLIGNLKCQICGEGLESVDAFKAHLRVHGKLPLYECQLCSRQFSDSSNFAKHKKIHNLRVMYCDLCKKKFQCKKQLIAHIMKHNTAVKVNCDQCDQSFYFNSDLRRHQKIVHRAFPVLYSCVICREKFRCFKNKLNHEWEVHKERKFKADCPICNEQFRKFGDLKKHVSKSHPGYHLDKKMYELLGKIKKSNLPIDVVEKILIDRLKAGSGSEGTSGTG